MKILLLGEYSNVHATLADGLRTLGHKVVVASNGDFWKNYPRDIDLQRKPGKIGGISLMLKVLSCLPRWRGYDVVQLINPLFLELRSEHLWSIYRYLKRYNSKVFLGAFGMDYYWVHENITRFPLKYSDFNIGKTLRTNSEALRDRQDWDDTDKGRLNQMMAKTCDGIIAGLYEYYACYHPLFPEKTVFIPFPIKLPTGQDTSAIPPSIDKLRIFIGINKERNSYKGTDIMLRAAETLKDKYPEKVILNIAESVPFAEYQHLMDGSDVILDQLYSYTPSMNPLLAMSKGIIAVGGGEPENYEIINEDTLRPIINVEPTYESVLTELENLVNHMENIPLLRRQSIEYVRKHHEYIKVANEYLAFWQQK